jgi:hypothetical protein
MITHVFASLPKEEHVMCMSKHTGNIENLTVKAVKKTIRTHLKAFIKGDEDTEKTKEVFYGEGTKTLCPGPKPKNCQTPKKRFKGDCIKVVENKVTRMLIVEAEPAMQKAMAAATRTRR